MVIIGIALAAIASFILSAALYGAPPVAAMMARTSTPRPGVSVPLQMLFVLFRSLLAAAVLAALLSIAELHGAAAGAGLGAITAALPVTILAGAIVHENVPVPTALVHMSDWVLKLVVGGALVGLFL